MNDFINLSRSLGRNRIYIQGAGGNSSIKRGGKLFIKASGYLMKDMRKDFGIACVEHSQINEFLTTKKQFRHQDAEGYSTAVKRSVIEEKSFGTPSMETGMHAVLPSTYVFHLHSVYVNIFTCMKYGERALRKMFEEDCEVIDFVNPGYQLAYVLRKKTKIPPILFLKNHGLVIHGDSLTECKKQIAVIHEKLEEFLHEKKVFREFEIYSKVQPRRKHLFPDSIVFSSVDYTQLRGQKKESFEEIMSASQYILEMIKKMERTPTFIDEEDVQRILNMGQEKHRLKVFHTR